MRGIDDFRFGVNYVPSKRWYYCWNDFDAEEIAEDLDAVAALGADHVRVMTLWPYFQPDPGWVSPAHLGRLGRVMDLAAARGLDVVVSAFCGHLTGQDFRQGWEHGRDFFTDPFMLEREELYLRSLADAVAARDNFIGFDLGNELNCSWQARRRADGDAWMRRMLSLCGQLAPDRVHVNGVDHGPFFRETTFSPEALARVQRIVSLHCWVFFTRALERGGPLSPASVHLAAAMTALARACAGDASKPVWVQEFGASEDWMNADVIPEFMEGTIRSAAAAGARWFTWWASHDIARQFEVASLEYTLGLLTTDNAVKPQAETFRRLAREYRARRPADVECLDPPPAPPTPPVEAETTWTWLEAWIDALPADAPGR